MSAKVAIASCSVLLAIASLIVLIDDERRETADRLKDREAR